MFADVVGRQIELEAIDRFLDRVSEGPAALLLEGEAGIGKTILWRAATEEARRRAYRVLACQPAASEAQQSYAGLADPLTTVDHKLVERLPEPQRRGLDVALLHRAPVNGETDQRPIATAFLAAPVGPAEEGPVLLAVDDYQWLDRPCRLLIEFATRRLSGPVGMLLTVRTEEQALGITEARLLNPDRQRLRIGPLSAGAPHHFMSQRTGRAFTRPALHRIHEVSGGNAFFALELAWAPAA